MNDPLDHMSPEELIEEASKHILTALAKLDDMRRVLREAAELPRRPSPSPGGRGGDGRGGQGVRLPRQRGPYPRRVE